MKRIPESGIVGEAALREAAATECGQVMGLVRAALAAKLGETGYQCIEAMYPDRVICCKDGRYYAYAYTIGEDNQVTLGEPQEVIEQYLPVRMAEAAAGDFLEAADPEGLAWDATLIRSGLSLNNTFYPDAVLREAVPLFAGRPIFAKGDLQHMKGEGKDVRNIVGWISEPKFIEGASPDTGRAAGRVNFSAATNLRAVLADAWKRGKKDLAGLSIDADGTATSATREGKRVRVATRISKVNSVDLIVEPGAGGALVRMVEAANSDEEHDNMKLKQHMLEAIAAALPVEFARINAETITEEDLVKAYREAVSAPAKPAGVSQAEWDAMDMKAKMKCCADHAKASMKEAAPGVTAGEVAEQVRMVEARAYARSTIATSKLPQAAQDKLLSDFTKRERFAEADVDAAIKAERAYLAHFTESGRVQIDATGNIQVEDRSVKIAGMFDAFFDPKHKDHRQAQSFKECYIEITGDRRVTGRLADMDRARMAESLGAAFHESVDTTTFSYVLGDAITRRLLADYRTPNQYDVWQPLASIVPASDFRTQHRTRYGGYGDLPIVLQGDPYTSLASPTDEEATYAVAKRGGTEDLTLEAVKNDDVGMIRQIPTKLSRSAKRTLAKFVLDFIRTNPLIYDGVAFFDNAHANLGAAALDATALAARRLAILKQTEAGSADRLGIPAKNLVVPLDLQGTAVDLFKNLTNVNDKTFIQNLALTVIPIWYWIDATDWAMTVDKDDMPWLEIAFLDGNEEPSLFVQDNPTVGSVFSNDKITYKMRHIYGGEVTNYRGADKSVVAN